uniref:Uncharacterized protein n=1 Tax=Mus musculus TaxID=10090 RepID=Q8C3T4_MOUSE|nr:unnamed protein product [Mus musculus]
MEALGRGDGVSTPICLQNHSNGPQRDTSKDSGRTAVLDGDRQCQRLLSIRHGLCTEGESGAPEPQARTSFGCPQGGTFSSDHLPLSLPLSNASRLTLHSCSLCLPSARVTAVHCHALC